MPTHSSCLLEITEQENPVKEKQANKQNKTNKKPPKKTKNKQKNKSYNLKIQYFAHTVYTCILNSLYMEN